MKRKYNIRKIAAGGVAVALGTYMLSMSETRITEEWKMNFHAKLQTITEKTYMTGLSYVDMENKGPREAIVECAFHLVPLGSYIDDKVVYTSELEDEMTNEMILAMQEADENEVDENGKLAKEDENNE